jgi:hypothetical protein
VPPQALIAVLRLHASLGFRRNRGLFDPSSDRIKRNHLPKIHHDQTSAKITGSGGG